MKKKGLIIATIVMVLVLAVSLTTATYAWFSATGNATVDNITFAIAQSADVLIGVEKDNIYDSTSNEANFYSDATTFEAAPSVQPTKWIGTTNGLGLAVNHELSLANASTAVYSTTSTVTPGAAVTPTTYTKGSGQVVTVGINMGNNIFKANGNGTTITDSSVDVAVENTDYLNIAFGVKAGKTNVLGYGCLVYIDKTDTLATIGILAGIHVAYNLNNTGWVELDVYGNNAYTATTTSVDNPIAPKLTIATGVNAGNYNYTTGITPGGTSGKGDAQVWIPILESNNGTAVSTDMQQLQLVVYLCGPDSDTVTSAKGAEATIFIKFLAINDSVFGG